MKKDITLSHVVAVGENNVIGKDNQLLWHLPNDLKFFKNITWAMPVIMGRKTFESMGKPLPGRTNIVITRNERWTAEGVLKADSLDHAIDLAATLDVREAFIIGGGQVYEQAMPFTDRIYQTLVRTSPEGDTYYPGVDTQQFQLVSELHFEKDEKHLFPYSFQVWERREENPK